MRTWLAYLLLLVTAFGVGLAGTVWASKALAARRTSPPFVDMPSLVPGAPERAPAFTVEC